MNFIGPIEGMNFSPIAEYNKYLNNNASFEIDSDLSFQNILEKQTNSLKQNPAQLRGGIEVNTNFGEVLAQSSVKASGKNDSAANFLNNFGNSISGGLNSVNDKVVASEKAQEAFAMGEDISVHDVMIATEKANLSMQMAMQLRNKIITAYNEINNVKV